MPLTTRFRSVTACLACGFLGLAPSAVRAQEPRKPVDEPGISLLDAARSGDVAVEAEGTGDGRMTIKVTNKTARRLKVVLPPGLVASGASGQMGGMGGMGGGGGGMGGGMGGGGGGMGGGGGGMGGGMGGGGGGGGMLVVPPTMGLMMLGRLIMKLVEPTESWDPSSLMAGGMMGGGMGGMGGGGMGGMGGGMGGMGGGMGGGFRSVPPTDLPNALVEPGKTRSLSTRVVSLNAPNEDEAVALPGKGEKLALGDVSEIEASPQFEAALRRLARDKAPENVSQLVLWSVAGMDWDEIGRISKGWANAQELALARELASKIDALPAGETGRLQIEFSAKGTENARTLEALKAVFLGKSMLGLAVETAVPAKPTGPSVACKVQVIGTAAKPEVSVQVAANDGRGTWNTLGKFTLPVAVDEAGLVKGQAFGDSLAEEVLKRLVSVKLVKGTKVKGKPTFAIRVENYSPLILNGVSVSGSIAKPNEAPKMLLGIALSPRRSLSVPASAEAVEAFGLKDGIKVQALDLSGL